MVGPRGPAPGTYVVFSATQSSPDFTRIYSESGGPINAAAIPWQTDFSSSGAAFASHCQLQRDRPQQVWVRADALHQTSDEDVAEAHRDFSVNVSASRLGTALNGTIVASVSGQGSVPLRSLLDSPHLQVGLVYKSWLAHGATVCISGARVVRVLPSGEQLPLRVHFREALEREAQLAAAAARVVNEYVRSAFALREQVVYAPSPNLTKGVFKTTVGVAGEGYSLVHDFVQDARSPLSLEALDALLGAAIASDCGQDAECIRDFEESAAARGLRAAGEARTVASACSLAATYLTSYRSDGRNEVGARGVKFEESESWLQELPRSPISADDCDGSARCAIGILRTAAAIDDASAAKYRHLRAVRNVVSTYYQPALVVLGATAAEATSADASHAAIAGHAIAVLLPKLAVLSALARASGKEIGTSGQTVLPPEKAAEVEETRFRAFFGEETVAPLPQEEQKALASWHVASKAPALALEPLAIEGTTPASPVLHETDAARRAATEQQARRDDAAFAKLSPNCFRSIKRLHVLGRAAGSDHRFYSALVEATFARDCPLYASKELRELGAAASQFVFAADGKTVASAGASPREVVDGSFVMLPLTALASGPAAVLDESSEIASRDVVAPRPPEPLQLDAEQSARLRRSVELLDELHSEMHNRRLGGHPVAYNVALSTLVFNPSSVEVFCKAVRDQANSCTVDKVAIPNLLTHDDGTDAGVYFTVNVAI